jgi:hypothetical protein
MDSIFFVFVDMMDIFNLHGGYMQICTYRTRTSAKQAAACHLPIILQLQCKTAFTRAPAALIDNSSI